MKLAKFEKLLINVEGFLHQPALIQYGNDWVPPVDQWVFRGRVVLAVGVKPVTMRVLQRTGADRPPTCPRFLGHYIVESEPFQLNDKTNQLVSKYHSQAERIARYIVEHKLYAAITHAPAFFNLRDPRFADIL